LEGTLASITITLDDALERCLRVRAAKHGKSMEEEEVCEILRQVVGHLPGPVNLGQSIHDRFAALADINLPVPERIPMRAAPEFD
jgi:antitoxin FitA